MDNPKHTRNLLALRIISGIVSPRKNIFMPKRTYQPKKRKRAKTHGFLVRTATPSGRKIVQSRRRKGRHQLTVKKPR